MGDPAGRFADYYPAWVDKLAGDATVEWSMLDGAGRTVEVVVTDWPRGISATSRSPPRPASGSA
jgi:hypothetical protein